MLKKNSYLSVAVILLMIPVVLTLYKFYSNRVSIHDIIPREVYEVNLELDIANAPENSYIKSFVPESNYRQLVLDHNWFGDTISTNVVKSNSGVEVVWEIDKPEDIFYTYSYQVEGKSVEYKIPEQSEFEHFYADTMQVYLLSEPFIQSSHPKVDSLAMVLKSENVLATLQSNFDYVKSLQSSNTRVLTDAASALRLNRASCNGQSRLFTALCRAQGIPSRVVGGIILEQTQKRTSHLWAEIFYRGNWIPFDVLNDQFASLPANYLRLYSGDQFLFRHNSDLEFDYQFVINKKYLTLNTAEIKGPHLWGLLRDLHISMNLLRTLLLLPLAALMIAIFRNIIGLKTFGILLPALIGLALVNVSWGSGLMAFLVVIVVVSFLHIFLERWSLLHVPKVAIILTCVILSILTFGIFGTWIGWELAELMVYLPIVIISITAERFAKVLNEENMKDALKMLANTFSIAFLTCLIFHSKILLGLFLTFPELYMVVLFIMLFLGRWIGMRVLEYQRFSPAFAS